METKCKGQTRLDYKGSYSLISSFCHVMMMLFRYKEKNEGRLDAEDIKVGGVDWNRSLLKTENNREWVQIQVLKPRTW